MAGCNHKQLVTTPNRYLKWGFILLIVGCSYLTLTIIPSVSKYRSSSSHVNDDRYEGLNYRRSNNNNNNNNPSMSVGNISYSNDRSGGSGQVQAQAQVKPLRHENDAAFPVRTISKNTTEEASLRINSHRNHSTSTMMTMTTTTTMTTTEKTTEIDLVSLTVRDDFFVLFNNSAIKSWLRYIQNVRSVTFIGPPKDYALFLRNMQLHYPDLSVYDIDDSINSSIISNNILPPIRWVNETHWKTTYQNKYKCPYPGVCQQLIKLHVFDLRTHLNLTYIGDNILVVDSDTVWSRNVTFVHPTNGTVHYFDVRGSQEPECAGMDPIKFTEGITAGSSQLGPRKPTLTPYVSCRRAEYPNATGARHIVHHMLFQYDVMMELHSLITQRWDVSTLWEAFRKCHRHDFCKSRVAEYELYFAYVSNVYPERVNLEHLVNGVNYMGSSAICSGEREMGCCREKGVILKGCHDHRIKIWERSKSEVGDMCC